MLDTATPRPGAFRNPEEESALAVIAVEMTRRLDEIVDDFLDRLWEEPEMAPWARPELRDAALANARQDIGAELRAMREGMMIPVACPAEVTTSARMAVAMGFPLWAALQCYRTGHAAQWTAWLDAVERLSPAPRLRRRLLELGAEFLFSYADRCSRWVEQAYARELQGRRESQARAIRALVAGHEPIAEDLNWDLDRAHIALVSDGPHVVEILSTLARAAEIELLTIATEAQTTWAWLSGSASLSQLGNEWEDTRIGVGEEGQGAAGFRTSLQQAQVAWRVARLSPPGTIARYADVALCGLLLANEDETRDFLTVTLGPLVAPEETALRGTLRALLAADGNATVAANMLGVTPRTVSNRLRRIRRVTAAPRTELDTALRLYPLLGAGRQAPEPG